MDASDLLLRHHGQSKSLFINLFKNEHIVFVGVENPEAGVHVLQIPMASETFLEVLQAHHRDNVQRYPRRCVNV